MKTIIERWVEAKKQHDVALSDATDAAEEAKKAFEKGTGQKLEEIKYWHFGENNKKGLPIYPLCEQFAQGRHYPKSLKHIQRVTEWFRQATPEFFAAYIQRQEDARD